MLRALRYEPARGLRQNPVKNVLIVDDHLVVRHGLKRFVEDLGGLAVAGAAESGRQALQLLAQGQWDLVLLDLSLSDMSGLDLLKRIKRLQPLLPVLILTAHAEDSHALAAMRGGAAGYITKDSSAEELQLAIRRAAGGQTYLGPKLTESLVSGLDPRSAATRPRHESLSQRERDVMLRLSRGQSLSAIAAQLCVNAKTVSTYRRRILDKLGVKTNAELVRYVVQRNLDGRQPS